MDDETRFWIAQQVTDRKNSSDIRPLFKQDKEVAGKQVNVRQSKTGTQKITKGIRLELLTFLPIL